MRSSVDRPPRSVRTAQTKVVEYLNYWMSLPETATFVKGLVDETYSKAGISPSSSSSAATAAAASNPSPARSPTPPKQQKSPVSPAPAVSAADAQNDSTTSATSSTLATPTKVASPVSSAENQQSNNQEQQQQQSGGGGAGGSSAGKQGAGRHHHSPSVQHFVDEMDFAHRIGGISPRAALAHSAGGTSSGGTSPGDSKSGHLDVPGGASAGSTSPGKTSPSDSSMPGGGKNAAGSGAPKSPKPGSLYPMGHGQSPLSGSLDLDPTSSTSGSGINNNTNNNNSSNISSGSGSGILRAKSPDGAMLGMDQKQEPHHFEHSNSGGSSTTSNNNSSSISQQQQNATSGSTATTSEPRASSEGKTPQQKIEQTARIEAAVKHQDDISLPKASVSDIPRFYTPPTTTTTTTTSSSSGTGKGGGGASTAGAASSRGAASSSSTAQAASSNSHQQQQQQQQQQGPLLFPPSTSAVMGTSSGLTEQQEVAVFTRIVNALANAGARKAPPKSAGAKMSRTPTPAAGGMTPLNAIVQITTESFGLPGVFAKMVHAKLVYGGKGSPQVPLTLASVRQFYDSHIHGNSIERRMFEVLLGASEVNFPVPAATTLFGGGPGAAAGAAAHSGGTKSRPGTASSRSAAALAAQQNAAMNNTMNSNEPSALNGGRNYLVRADFAPLVQILLDHHPGLAFLKQTADFQSRYLETVIIRIFFELDRNDTNRVTWEEFRRSLLPTAIRKADSHEDINLVLDFFSYEHFYVLYCRFWELDTDKDFLISKDDLVRYYPENTVNPMIVDRIVAGVGRPLRSHTKGRMNFEDFVWFCLCEEHKAHPRAIAYWFRILDVDQDGIISGYELEVFYAHTKEKMKLLTTESIVFDDVMCQVSDMMSFSRRAPMPSGGGGGGAPAAGENEGNTKNGTAGQNATGNKPQQRPGTAGARPRSAAPTGSAARLMMAAPSARPVVGADIAEGRRLSIVGSADVGNSSVSSPLAAPTAGSGGSFSWLSSYNNQQRFIHAGFTLSDFLRCPTAAHVAINMLTNVSKFLQFEQRDPFVATQGERAAQQQQSSNNNLNLDGVGSLLNPNAGMNSNAPLERNEWDRFCRNEYDRMSESDEQ